MREAIYEMTEAFIRLLDITNDDTVIIIPYGQECLTLFWESYSALANTEGGLIVIGAVLNKNNLKITGIPENKVSSLIEDIWAGLTYRKAVSENLILKKYISKIEINGAMLLKILIPEADRHNKPVYIGSSPYNTTYIRYQNVNCLLGRSQTELLLREQKDFSADCRIIDYLKLNVLCPASIGKYREAFDQADICPAWSELALEEFLIKTGAAAVTSGGTLVPTAAGLLMFGTTRTIRRAFPKYYLEYREEFTTGSQRNKFKLTSWDGTWSGNVFDFYCQVSERITANLTTPYILDHTMNRMDEGRIYTALLGAVVNCLVHADYSGAQGIEMVKYNNRIRLANPGRLRISKEEFQYGLVRETRNTNLYRLFSYLYLAGKGEPGIALIRSLWEKYMWQTPEFVISLQPERVTVELKIEPVDYHRMLTGDNGRMRKWSAEELEKFEEKMDSISMRAKTAEKARKVHDTFGSGCEFSWKEVSDILWCSKNSAASLIRFLYDNQLVERTGKSGWYRFIL